ncbi:MAG: hypothetical protein OEN50_06605 [Deltaproteobacteria bacterium]|nr:hypothetical protein [Deltaproteobacteria bacterium]
MTIWLRILIFTITAWLCLTRPVAHGAEKLVPLSSPGPWSGVSGIIGYGGKIWFVNSNQFVDHNSADIYSYDPATGNSRYEKHLFSQDAGRPAVANGLLYWPFEDARFSAGRGEYMVTNGRHWRWRIVPEGQVFHIHAMLNHHGGLYAATGAWRAGLQYSHDGRNWRVLYDHPTPPRRVTRITTLAALGDTLYAGLTDYRPQGKKLLRWDGRSFQPVKSWPPGTMVTALTRGLGWLYGVNVTTEGSALWRTNGDQSERISAFDGRHVRGLAVSSNALLAVTGQQSTGSLWRSFDGKRWMEIQRFDDAIPVDVAVYGEKAFVGTARPDARGTLWGSAELSSMASIEETARIKDSSLPLPEQALKAGLQSLDDVLADPTTYAHGGASIRRRVQSLAQSGTPKVGVELTRRLDGSFPDVTASRFGGRVTVTAATLARWYLLWGAGLTGHGKVPPRLFSQPFNEKPNRSEKYLYLGSAAAWTAARLGQNSRESIAALIQGLGRVGQPLWVDGDYIGALTELTGQRFGYDTAAWHKWWRARSRRQSMTPIPDKASMTGMKNGEPVQ